MLFGGGLMLVVFTFIEAGVTTILNAVETSSLQSIYGDTYVSACEPVPSGKTAVSNAPDVADRDTKTS